MDKKKTCYEKSMLFGLFRCLLKALLLSSDSRGIRHVVAFEVNPIFTTTKKRNNNNNNNNNNMASSRIFLSLNTEDTFNLQQAYDRARAIRTLRGQEAGQPFYQQILEQNPKDWTAGTRLAACIESPLRQDEACGGKYCSVGEIDDLLHKRAEIQKLKNMLEDHSYNHCSISRFLQVSVGNSPSLSCNGPLFASPAPPGAVTSSSYPLTKSNVSGLSCLVTLFLLGLVVPRAWLVDTLGEEHCMLMQTYGWMYPCTSSDPPLMIPYVHVFPMDFYSTTMNRDCTATLHLVTDLHPRILSTTTVGQDQRNQRGNTVMYIGPDSMALVQHFSPYSYLRDNCTGSINGLDLGTGSGIQALAALTHWKVANKSMLGQDKDNLSKTLKMTAVDINPRALQFTKFNAILNGFEDDIICLYADLVSGELLGDDPRSVSTLDEYLQQQSTRYDIILANPPFLPVPSDARVVTHSKGRRSTTAHSSQQSDNSTIAQRYGLYSSGGGDGEVLLQRIIELASRHLNNGGIIGIVSEFFTQAHDPHFERFQTWWNAEQNGPHGSTNVNTVGQDKGVLFLNEFPIDVATYASRRADNLEEESIWKDHLESLNVSKASPGMLYLQKGEHSGMNLTLLSVPKSSRGSIWTLSNIDAIGFTQSVSAKIFGWPI